MSQKLIYQLDRQTGNSSSGSSSSAGTIIGAVVAVFVLIGAIIALIVCCCCCACCKSIADRICKKDRGDAYVYFSPSICSFLRYNSPFCIRYAYHGNQQGAGYINPVNQYPPQPPQQHIYTNPVPYNHPGSNPPPYYPPNQQKPMNPQSGTHESFGFSASETR